MLELISYRLAHVPFIILSVICRSGSRVMSSAESVITGMNDLIIQSGFESRLMQWLALFSYGFLRATWLYSRNNMDMYWFELTGCKYR